MFEFYIVLENTLDSINYKCSKNTNISDNMFYLKITWASLSDHDKNAMSWRSTGTYANETALISTKVLNTYVFILGSINNFYLLFIFWIYLSQQLHLFHPFLNFLNKLVEFLFVYSNWSKALWMLEKMCGPF